MSSLENGMRILKLFGQERSVLRVNEVSEELGLPRSSVSRLMASLAGEGFLEKNQAGGYQVGVASLVLRESYFANRSLFREIDQMLFRLVERFPFTALAATLNGAEAIIVNTRQGTNPLRVVRAVGTALPSEETTTGTCLLAYKNDSAAIALIEKAGRAANADFLARMASFRREGFLFDVSRRTKGVASIGSAILPREGEGIAFCLTYPLSEGGALQDEMTQSIVAEAAALGRIFGDSFWSGR